jgi:hypothetical protein
MVDDLEVARFLHIPNNTFFFHSLRIDDPKSSNSVLLAYPLSIHRHFFEGLKFTKQLTNMPEQEGAAVPQHQKGGWSSFLKVRTWDAASEFC